MQLISRAAILLDEVARIGSIRAAAERLNTSPSAVNRHILGLEADYGVPLFERLPRGMRLTMAGEILVNNIRRWRREQDRGDIQIEELRGMRRGHARVGVIDTIADDIMPRVFRRLHETNRNIMLDVLVGSTETLTSELVAGNLDLAVCFALKPRRDLNILLTKASRAGVLVRPDHPLASKLSVRLVDVMDFELVLPASSFILRSMLEAAFHELPVRPKAVVSTNSTAVMKSMLAYGEQVAIIGCLAAQREIELGTLTFVPFVHEKISSADLQLAVQVHHFPTPARMQLIETFNTVLQAFGNSVSPGSNRAASLVANDVGNAS